MAKLNHPNVAQIYEVGEQDGRTFIAMEFIRGDTLSRWRQRRQPSWREVLAVYHQAGLGLAAAHAVGLVHRDFKPDNAMIGDDGRVRVLDFGLARAEEHEPTAPEERVDHRLAPSDDALRTPLTREGSVMGTPAYMAPEQHLGETVDAKADQFSFCVALWEALYSGRPYSGTTRTELAAAVTRGKLNEPPRDTRVPPWVRAVVERGLAVRPESRFHGMQALLTALGRDPTQARRRVGAAIAAVAAVGLGLGAWGLHRRSQVAACAEQGEQLSSSWTEDARAEVRDALLAVGPRYAASTVERVLPRLDQWADQWSRIREQNCLASRVTGTRTVELERLAVECLDEQRETFDSLAGMLVAADEQVLESAAGSIAALGDPEDCVDEAKLRRRVTDDGPAARAATNAWRRRLASASAVLAASRSTQGVALIEAVIEETSAPEFQVVHAEALALAAAAYAEVGDSKRSLERGEQATLLAMRQGSDELAFDTIMRIAEVLREPANRDRRRWWMSLAQMLVDRLDAQQDLRGAELLATLALGTSDGRERLALHERALAILESRLGSDHPMVGTTISDIGAALESVGAHAEAEVHHERGLAIREHALGPDHPHVGNSLINVAHSHASRGENAQAIALTERALGIWELGLGPGHSNVALALGNLAGYAMAQDDHARARPLLERAIAVIEAGRGSDSPYLVQHLVNLGTIHQRLGEYETSAALFDRAVRLAEGWGGRYGVDVATPLVGASEIAMLRGQPVKAIGLLERAVLIFDRSQSDRPNRAAAGFALARALWDGHGERGRAQRLAEQAAAQYRELPGDWSYWITEIEGWLAGHSQP